MLPASSILANIPKPSQQPKPAVNAAAAPYQKPPPPSFPVSSFLPTKQALPSPAVNPPPPYAQLVPTPAATPAPKPVQTQGELSSVAAPAPPQNQMSAMTNDSQLTAVESIFSQANRVTPDQRVFINSFLSKSFVPQPGQRDVAVIVLNEDRRPGDEPNTMMIEQIVLELTFSTYQWRRLRRKRVVPVAPGTLPQ